MGCKKGAVWGGPGNLVGDKPRAALRGCPGEEIAIG